MSDFVLCIDNRENESNLIIGKLYRRLPDAEAAEVNLIRVVDEDTSEEDGYLYSPSIFESVEISEIAKKALLGAGMAGSSN